MVAFTGPEYPYKYSHGPLCRLARRGHRVEAAYIAFPFGPADHLDHPAPSFVGVTANSGSTRLTLLAGPELGVKLGTVRASLHALAGPVGAFTVMSLDGFGTDERYSQRKRYSDLAVQAQAGLGVYRLQIAIGT